jgi:hypothetical protein
MFTHADTSVRFATYTQPSFSINQIHVWCGQRHTGNGHRQSAQAELEAAIAALQCIEGLNLEAEEIRYDHFDGCNWIKKTKVDAPLPEALNGARLSAEIVEVLSPWTEASNPPVKNHVGNGVAFVESGHYNHQTRRVKARWIVGL